MNNENYYTPSIEDIHVGYECEHTTDTLTFRVNNTDKIIKDKLYPYDVINYLKWIIEDGHEISEFIRTPYLTKEQIEKEGWVKLDNKFNDTQRIVHIPDYELKTEFGSLRLYIPDLDKVYEDIRIEKYTKGNPNDVWSMSSFYTIYRGLCPSINEFRQITKLLNIK